MLWPEVIDELTVNHSFFNYNLIGSNFGMGERWKNNEEFVRLVNLKNDTETHSPWDMALVNIRALVETTAPRKVDKSRIVSSGSNDPLNRPNTPPVSSGAKRSTLNSKWVMKNEIIEENEEPLS
jgi:hypothetical protein